MRIDTDKNRSTENGKANFDLLHVPLLGAALGSPVFLYAVQAVALMFFVGLAALAWDLFPPEGVTSKLYAKSNLVNLGLWGVWWPCMVLGAAFLGRAWCMVCPLELVSNLGERLGRRMGLPQQRFPRWIRAGWLVLLLYLGVQMAVAGLQLHRIPAYTAYFLLILLGLAFFSGLFYRDRAFCRGFCPVAMLLSVYGRGGALGIRPASTEVCDGCAEKYCIDAGNRNKWHGRSCPSLLHPPTLNTNRDCLVCCQCVKVCKPGNMQLTVRAPFAGDDTREPHASWPVTLFVMALSGFVTYEVSGGWSTLKSGFLWAPHQFSLWVGHPALEGWIKGVWMLALFPVLLWLFLGGLAKLFAGSESMGRTWRRMALPMAVVVLGGHMAKALEKLSTWGGYLPEALRDARGLEASLAYQNKLLATPAPLVPHGVYAAVGVVLILLGAAYGLREARLRQNKSALNVPLLLLAASYAACVAGWALK